MAETAPVLLQMTGISKQFPGVKALQHVDLQVRAGECLALVGENGAGKSTLMKILAGILRPDSGRLLLDGRPVLLDSVRTASAHRIALIHQELNLADNLDIAGNICLGREPRRWGILDRRAMRRRAVAAMRQVGLDERPETPLSRLPIGKRQLVEIARALSIEARLLIMDEPTSSLSALETHTLFQVVHTLRRRGVSVIYISHRLSEIHELADRVVVLRDGQNAGELTRDQIEHDRMVRLMVGRELSQFYRRERPVAADSPPRKPGSYRTQSAASTPDSIASESDQVAASLDTRSAPNQDTPSTSDAPMLLAVGVATGAHPEHELTFHVRGGEIVGLAGLVGAGRTELLRVLFGVDRAAAGRLWIAGQPVELCSPADAIRTGLALAPEDRTRAGLILAMSVAQNVSLPGLADRGAHLGILNRRHERDLADTTIARLRIRSPDAEQIARNLSGGNQQKVVLGKWLAMQPRVLLLDEPTRGIDVGAKREIYELMEHLAAAGVALLFASNELEEILGLSDRVLVMHEGRLAGELRRDELDEQTIMRLATGG